jgi:hypothetical protein
VVDGCTRTKPGRKTPTAKTARKNAQAIDANYHRMFASESRHAARGKNKSALGLIGICHNHHQQQQQQQNQELSPT